MILTWTSCTPSELPFFSVLVCKKILIAAVTAVAQLSTFISTFSHDTHLTWQVSESEYPILLLPESGSSVPLIGSRWFENPLYQPGPGLYKYFQCGYKNFCGGGANQLPFGGSCCHIQLF